MINEQSPIKTSVIDGILWGVVAYVCCVCGIVVEGGMPAWAHIGPFGPQRWSEARTLHGVDERAQDKLLELARYSPEGARQANQALNRLSRMRAEGQHIDSASALMQGTVKAAWKNMQASGDAP